MNSSQDDYFSSDNGLSLSPVSEMPDFTIPMASPLPLAPPILPACFAFQVVLWRGDRGLFLVTPDGVKRDQAPLDQL